MENVVKINKDINVIAYYFRNTGVRLRCFPKRIEFEGKRVDFTEAGMRHPVRKGQRMVDVFDMTDGTTDYRLEFDPEKLNWTLLEIADLAYSQGFKPAIAT